MRGWLGIIAVTIGGPLLGCAAPPPPPEIPPLRLTQSPPPGAERQQAAESLPPLDAATRADIDQLLADLESLGPVTQEAKRALAAELAATQPALRRALIQQHRALIAYRKQQAARATTAAGQSAAMPTEPDATAVAPGATAVSAVRDTASIPQDEPRRASASTAPDVGTVAYGSPSGASERERSDLAATTAALVESHLDEQLAAAALPAGLQFPASARGAVVPREEDDRDATAEDVAADAAASQPTAERPPVETPNASAATAASSATSAEQADQRPSASPAAMDDSPPDRIDDPQVAPASHVARAPPTDDWQSQLAATIAALEDDLAADAATAADDRHARLRMLYLLAGRREDALRLPADMPPDEQEFWSRELFGLSAWLDAEQIADPRRRATEAARHLHDAAASLGTLGNLQVRNVAFCTEVKGFGVCTPFARSEFKPREQVILYWEVENLRIESTPKGHRTALKARYQIFDAQGAGVDQGDFPVTEEYCQNRRRDYFVRYYLWLPERLYDGRYTLKLTVEDALNGNVGQGSLEFTVRAR